MTLGQKLKKARLDRGLTQSQVVGDRITRNMLSQLENELPIGVRIVLTDATQSSGEICGGELILRLLPGFAKNTVNVPDVLNKIRQKVSALCGAPMQIRLEELQTGGAPGLDKLDFLGKFGNVTIQ